VGKKERGRGNKIAGGIRVRVTGLKKDRTMRERKKNEKKGTGLRRDGGERGQKGKKGMSTKKRKRGERLRKVEGFESYAWGYDKWIQ